MDYSQKVKYPVPETPADALKLALEREKAAYDFYDQAANQFQQPNLKNLFEILRDEEASHIEKMKV